MCCLEAQVPPTFFVFGVNRFPVPIPAGCSQESGHKTPHKMGQKRRLAPIAPVSPILERYSSRRG